MNRSLFVLFSSEDLIMLYMGLYNQEYGNKKGLEVLTKINSSEKIHEFINRLRFEKLSPGDDGFITVVNAIPYFFFSKAETLGYASLFAIKLWIEQSVDDPSKLNDDSIHRIIVSTIIKAEGTKTNLSGKLTFFQKYYDLLQAILERS